MLPPGEGYGSALVADFHPTARFAAADDREPARVGRSGEQLVVLAEGQVLMCRAGGEWNLFELDHQPAAGASGDMARVSRQAVREIEHRVRVARQLNGVDTTPADLFAAYERGEALATRVVDNAVELWGMAAANLVSLFNPETIVFGGGVFGPATRFIPRIRAEAEKWAQPIAIQQVRFVESMLGPDVGLYGAARMAAGQ